MSTTKSTRRPAPALHTAAKPHAAVDTDERRRPQSAAQTEAGSVAAPLAPSAASPTQSAQTDGDATTTVRVIVRAILATLDGPSLAALLAALVTWFFAVQRAADITGAARTMTDVSRKNAERERARAIAENAHQAFADATFRARATHHSRAVVELLFGGSAAQITRYSHTTGAGDGEMLEVLGNLRSVVEAIALDGREPLAADLLAIALHPEVNDAERAGAFEALFAARGGL